MDDPITSLVISPGPDGTRGISHPPLRLLWPGARALPTDLLESISQQQIHSNNHFFEPPCCTVQNTQQIWWEMLDTRSPCDVLWIINSDDIAMISHLNRTTGGKYIYSRTVLVQFKFILRHSALLVLSFYATTSFLHFRGKYTTFIWQTWSPVTFQINILH